MRRRRTEFVVDASYALRSSQCDAASPVRTLRRVEVQSERPDLVAVEVEGGGFLRNMVRIIVGTLVDVGIGRHPSSWVAELLTHGDRRKGGITAPAKGLFLKEVQYPEISVGPGGPPQTSIVPVFERCRAPEPVPLTTRRLGKGLS